MSGNSDTGRTAVRFAAASYRGPSERIFRVVDREIRRQSAVVPWWYQPPTAFVTAEQIAEHLALNPMPCLLCGRLRQNVGAHIKAHGISGRQYKERFGLPLKSALCVAPLSRHQRKMQLLRIEKDPSWATRLKGIHLLGTLHTSRISVFQRQTARSAAVARERDCVICGARFTPPRHRNPDGHGKFCSHKCSQESRSRLARGRWRACAVCGRTLPPGSQPGPSLRCKECYNAARAVTMKRCEICGGAFSPAHKKQRYCSHGCANNAQKR